MIEMWVGNGFKVMVILAFFQLFKETYFQHKWTIVNPILISLFHMTCHRTFSKSCMTGVTSGPGTAYLSGAPEFTPGFLWGSCY